MWLEATTHSSVIKTMPVGSQQSVVPKGLPFLPGNGFKDPTQQDFKKSHVFDVHHGISISHDPGVVAPPSATNVMEAPKMLSMPSGIRRRIC